MKLRSRQTCLHLRPSRSSAGSVVASIRALSVLAPLLLISLVVTSFTSSSQAQNISPQEAKKTFFNSERMYYVRITGWDNRLSSIQALAKARTVPGSKLEIFITDPASSQHCPDAIATTERRVHEANGFEIRTSGNMTKGTPKSSYKLKFSKKERFLGMGEFNLKSMWNDVSQMREALAWDLFAQAEVPAPRHTYAKFCINGRYLGLYSVIEEIDKGFLSERFSANDKGNLYKAYWIPQDIGPATLAYRRLANGDDSGRAYVRNADPKNRTYELKTNNDADDPAKLQTYDDLAMFIKILNTGDPTQDEFRKRMESVFDVKTFLRWAAVNMLIGAWDNYWGTPANYLLYNSGPAKAPKSFMEQPYFNWIPWDYDNSFGITYFSTQWQYVDVVDWAASTKAYYKGRKLADIPLITRLLANPTYRAYYLEVVERLLNTQFNPRVIQVKTNRLFNHIKTAAFLESDSPRGMPHTGRQFTNDQVYWNGGQHQELKVGYEQIWGILHYVTMRHDSARQQLLKLKRAHQ